MFDLICKRLQGKKVLLLGFGREGRSTYSFIRKVLPDIPLAIADLDESVKSCDLFTSDDHLDLLLGDDYLDHLGHFDLIIKSPGIALHNLPTPLPCSKLTSQTDLFLQVYSKQVVGVTGTKGKSTTSSLLYHTLKYAGRDALLLGNIGRPAFDLMEEIRPETVIVFELSSHQLEFISVSPHIAILLNLYQEHLDAYKSFLDYQLSKMNILKFQNASDHFLFNADDDLIRQRISETETTSQFFPFSMTRSLLTGCFVSEETAFFSMNGIRENILDLKRKRKLKGDHNVLNILAVIGTCRILGIEPEWIQEGVAGFTGLEHRLEFAGNRNDIAFYNDSIATIPEACIEAVKALGMVDTLIVGGFDRGIDYSALAIFLSKSGIRNFIFSGDAGSRIMKELEQLKTNNQRLFRISRFDEFLDIALKYTRPGTICLLSPAAASYNEFQNFEMRGKRFKELVSGSINHP